METDFSPFLEACAEARRIAFSFSNPLIVHHLDADGVSSGAIVESAFRTDWKKHRRICIKKLGDTELDSLKDEKEIIFVDLGGGNPRVNELQDVLIIDHHQTKDVTKHQINPLLYGIDGGDELSAAGTAALVFDTHYDLGVVGAVGDMQYPLRGANRLLIKKGKDRGEIELANELRMFGRYSRPIVQFLAYSDEPYLPGLSFNELNTEKFLSDLQIPVRKGEKWRTYSDLTTPEKKRLVSALADLLVEKGRAYASQNLVGESYLLTKRERTSETYDASEFSTMLNACGRHGRPDIGVAVCLGEKWAEKEASDLLRLHKTRIREGILFARESIVDFGPFLFLDARDKIEDSIVGIVCGMAIGGSPKPIIGIASSEDGKAIKVSSRGTRAQINAGLNLGNAMAYAVKASGGVGGGHKIAAGANIPAENLNLFLTSLADFLRQKP
ncbi:MAG: DHH family phosphoesterase [Syntrophales bacterium]|nr:DHH family phosphoesterase [Candidatus ainarchaeum sp.]MDD5096324.1 DHH family phosphoesterase [Candidatus ainarchaeum sp.]MDD5533593.1 DHH family phosphoesterase [Syntrophales bacterium]